MVTLHIELSESLLGTIRSIARSRAVGDTVPNMQLKLDELVYEVAVASQPERLTRSLAASELVAKCQSFYLTTRDSSEEEVSESADLLDDIYRLSYMSKYGNPPPDPR